MRPRLLLVCLLALVSLASSARPAAAHDLCFAGKTEHCLADPFSDYWENNGGLPIFGYPITAAAETMDPDTGLVYVAQWLERNRFEDHPENAGTPYRVLLGLLGKERLAQLDRDWRMEPGETPQAGCLWFAETGRNVCDQAGGMGFKQYWESH
ncbi:MAG TPA: hypothetical protein VD886_09710, partial [Herpetosiphonaceae bacterium]|nr:hypothetical protein [Herpetosiphonaceae bacterium]